MSVPASAVILRGAEHLVVVQVAPGVFERRRVQTADEGARDVVVTSGIQPNERVVTENALLLLQQFRMAQQDAALRAPPASAPASQPEAARP